MILHQHPTCTLCPRHLLAPCNPGIPASTSGLPPSDSTPVLCVILPSPTYQDHRHNIIAHPSSQTGDLLHSTLLHHLATIATIHILPLTRCNSNPNPAASAYKACFPHHLADLTLIHAANPIPKQIHMLLLGAAAATQFHRLHLQTKVTQKQLFTTNGRTQQILGRPHSIFSTWHPAAIILNNSLIHSTEDHLTLLTNHLLNLTQPITPPSIQLPRFPH